MSFPNHDFWMEKGCVEEDVIYENSSIIKTKRPHQWFMDGPEADLLPNKKHAAEVPTNLFPGVLSPNASEWGNALGFHSVLGHFTERLFDTETARPANFHDETTPLVSPEKILPRRSGKEELYGDPSFCLSASHTLEDPESAINYGRIRQEKASRVRDTDNVISSPHGHGYERLDNSFMSVANPYRINENSTLIGLAFGKAERNVISMTENYDTGNGMLISMGHPHGKLDENISMASYRESNNSLETDLTFNKVDNNLIYMGQVYDADESSASKNEICYNKNGYSYNKGHSTIISFGGSNADDLSISGGIISNYELLMGQSSSQISEIPNDRDLVESSTNTLGGHAAYPSVEFYTKKVGAKVPKKAQNNSFPSNVRSLVSTGMLDGVPVKYIAWSQEKELRGVIKGSGYQCGCQSCNFSKVINAYEFERHAGCKTKHPNNHIYFENGKTVYGIVQELRKTPQDILFDVMQTITGSPINQKSFQVWRESYLAATHELMRIYGRGEGNLQ